MGATLVDTSMLRPAFVEAGQSYNCKGQPPEWWFDLLPQTHQFSTLREFRQETQRVSANRAKAVELCNTCPAKRSCRQFAIDNRIEHGIFGGELETERARYRS